MSWGDTMGDITRDMMNRFRRARIRARRYTAGFLATATLVGCGVGWGLRQTGISATADTFCGAEEHTHTQQCYEKVLVCGMEEGETLPTQAPHVHEESCYGLQKICVCGTEAHAHSDACYAMQRNLTCTSGDHSHGDACYTTSGGALTCAAAEHTHSDECKDAEGNLTCDQQEHSHGDGCFSPVERTLSCTLPEHTHDDSCYGDAEKVLICGHGEHEHTDACYEEQQVLVCTLSTEPEAQTPHVHSEACYEERRICGKEEHCHTDQCLSDPTADVEDADAWSANACNPGSGVWAADLLAVASAQLGYAESQRNFRVDENGVRRGYTRYGAWYGDPYGSWNGMFLAYCLHFAGVPESAVSQRAGVSALLADLSGSDRLKNPDDYTPQPGDIAVFGDRVGVIREAGETLSVICGDVDGIVAELSVAPSGVNKFIQIAEKAVYSALFAARSGEGTSTETEVDLKDYTTSVKLSYGNPNQDVVIDQNTTPSITLKDGDPIKIYINYRFEAGVTTNKAYYDLPSEITTSITGGKVINQSGQEVGTFTISGGKIEIVYSDNAWEGTTAHNGYVYFEGNASLSDTNDQTEVSFPGAGKITIVKEEEAKDYGYWLEKSVVKAGENNDQIFQIQEDGSIKVSYKVTLTATGKDGSGTDNLTITDILNRTQWDQSGYLKASYDLNSFKLVKTGSDQNLIGTDGITQPSPDNTQDNPTAEISNLPPLTNKDESYILTYDVIVPASEFTGNEVKSVKNWVKTDDYHNAQNSEATKDYKLQKGSYYDTGTGRIVWTITVNNSLGSVDGYKVWDELSENLAGKVVGDIRITDRNGQSVGTLTNGSTEFNHFFNSENGYTFGTGSNNPPYRFTYETEAPDIPDGQTEITASNTAKLTPNAEETITVTQNQPVSSAQWTVGKKREAASGDQVFWSIQATNTLGSKHFTVTDTIVDAKLDSNAWPPKYYSGTHYALISELESAFEGQYGDGKGLYVVLDDGNGNTEEVHWGSGREDVIFNITYTAAPETNVVTEFKIDVSSTVKNVKGIYLSSYPTHVDFTQTSDGDTWIFENDFKVDTTSASANYTYTKYADFIKRVSVDHGNTWTVECGQDEDVTLNTIKDHASGHLKYQIVLITPAEQTEDIVIVDTLPEGVSYVDDHYWFTVDGNYQWNWTRAYDATNNTITFTIPASLVNDGSKHNVVVYYCVNVSDDPDWNNTLIGSKNYRNVARWGDKEAETNTLVKRYNTTLSKEAGQISDSNKIQYTVVINPNKEDLANGADSFTLEDTLNMENGIKGSLDPGSFQLYYYRDVGGTLDLTNNAPIIKLDWKASSPLHFSVTVPNRTALVLRYVFEVDMASVPAGTNDFAVNNVASIAGNTSTSKGIRVQNQKAGGGFNGDKLQLIKKDKDSGLLISGARFSIKSYDKVSQSWTAFWEEEIRNGQIDFGISGTTTNLQPDVLYSIQETVAPDNYRLDETPKYVIFSSDTDTSAFQTATGKESVSGTNNDTVTVNEVTFLATSGTSALEFENQYTHLDVQKVWRDKNDTLIDAPVDSIQVQLMRYPIGAANQKEKVGDPVTLEKAQGWAYSWSDLDSNYYYTVEEVLPEDWKLWTVSYVNNGGIQTGLITITNVVSDEFTYELPNTGGTGTRNYVLFGTLAMILAGCGMVVTRKKHDTGVYER